MPSSPTVPTIAPFGSWKSPIAAQRVAAGTRPLGSPQIDGEHIYWLEGLTAEAGRVAAVRAAPDGGRTLVTPAPFNVRSRVHEYGGGALRVAGGRLYFSNFADNLVYLQLGDGAPQALTANSQHRNADFTLDAARQRLIAVREDHSQPGHEARNSLVAVGLPWEGAAEPGAVEIELAGGFDFYAAPRLSPDGRQLAWLCWNHPRMPWEGTELWLADVAQDGSLARAHRIAGGEDESLCQPLWSPRGHLFVVSDRSGWWNLYRVAGETLEPVCPMQAEFGRPQWVFGQSMYGFTGGDEIVAVCIAQGFCKLLRIDLASGDAQPIDTPFTDLDELRAGPGFVVALAGSPSAPQQVVRIDVASGAHVVLARSIDELPEAADLSVPERLNYPSSDGRVARAFFYPPCNQNFAAPAGELPPLLVLSHGGPTSMSTSSLKLSVQYWTSRGFAVLDVNYGGSTGFGRAYMKLLQGQWGVVDVEDCVAGARHLAERGRVDGERMAIRGGSAGGFTTLSALAFHRVFKAGASHYGVSDLKALDDDTHKFESRYTAWLVAPPPERDRLYAERSPAHHAGRIACPVIFFQGLDDKVVPPAQSEVMVEALKARGIPVAYLTFEGEGHGFRRKETIQRALEAEAWFYAKVFGFALADSVAPVDVYAKTPTMIDEATKSIATFVPAGFKVPETLETAEFRLRMLTVNDVVKDFDAVMTSVEHLKTVWPGSDWPEGLTLEQNLIDLGWHQKEFQMRQSFAYTVVTPSESRVIGCVYIDPARKRGHDAAVFLWARQSELAGGLETRLYAAVKGWLAETWPFRNVAFPGRDISWDAWRQVPGV